MLPQYVGNVRQEGSTHESVRQSHKPLAGEVDITASSPYYDWPRQSSKAAGFSLLHAKSTQAVPHMAAQLNFPVGCVTNISKLQAGDRVTQPVWRMRPCPAMASLSHLSPAHWCCAAEIITDVKRKYLTVVSMARALVRRGNIKLQTNHLMYASDVVLFISKQTTYKTC